MNPDPVSQWALDHVARWAIVTLGGTCDLHDGPCPAGWWGPYLRADAENAIKFVGAGHLAHLVPVMAERQVVALTEPSPWREGVTRRW